MEFNAFDLATLELSLQHAINDGLVEAKPGVALLLRLGRALDELAPARPRLLTFFAPSS